MIKCGQLDIISIKLNYNRIYIIENFSNFSPLVHIGITDPCKAVFVRTKVDLRGQSDKQHQKMKKENAIIGLLRQAIETELKVLPENISIDIQGKVAEVSTGADRFSVWLDGRKLEDRGIVCYTADGQEMIKASGAKYILLHTPRGRKGYFFEVGRLLCKGAVAHHGQDELGDDVLVYMLFSPIYSV